MQETVSVADDREPPRSTVNSRVAPNLKLSPRGLTIGLLTMVVAGLSVYAIFPESVGGPPLPVTVSLSRQAVETTGGQGALLTEVVVVENIADHELKRISIEINDQYLLFQKSPLAAGKKLVLPQRIFTDKRSSQRFNPDKYRVEDIVVTGQLPSGSRGVSKFEFE